MVTTSMVIIYAEDRLLIRVITQGPHYNKPEILKRIMACFEAKSIFQSLDELRLEFREEERIITILKNLVEKYGLDQVTGIRWNGQEGHSISIVCY